MDTQTIIGEIKSVLANLNFPAHKDEVVAQAEQQGCSQETQQTLQKLPDQKFNSLQDILSKLPIGNLEGEVEKFL